jgi:hypothetical protein
MMFMIIFPILNKFAMNFISSTPKNVKVDGDWKAFKYEFFMINLLGGGRNLFWGTQLKLGRADNGVFVLEILLLLTSLLFDDNKAALSLQLHFGEISIILQIIEWTNFLLISRQVSIIIHTRLPSNFSHLPSPPSHSIQFISEETNKVVINCKHLRLFIH